MLRRVPHAALPRRRRRILHRQVGEALERLYGRRLDAYLEALAVHFGEAEDAEKILRYAQLAATKAAAVFAYDDAARYLQQAIAAAEELDRSADRLELVGEPGEVMVTAGQ